MFFARTEAERAERRVVIGRYRAAIAAMKDHDAAREELISMNFPSRCGKKTTSTST